MSPSVSFEMLRGKNDVLVAFVGTQREILPGVDGLYVGQKQAQAEIMVPSEGFNLQICL